MNEWEMQKRLTEMWSRRGLIFQGHKLFLAAWEVMTDDWGINDYKRDWRQPSLDFLFCDRSGGLWGLEMKAAASSPRAILSLLCQVSHRAILLERSFLYERLALAFFETRSGIHWRDCGKITDDFRRTHAKFFRLRSPLPKNRFNRTKIHRIVASADFGSRFYPILRAFNYSDPTDFARKLKRDYNTRTPNSNEFKRFISLPLTWGAASRKPVLYLNLCDELAKC